MATGSQKVAVILAFVAAALSFAAAGAEFLRAGSVRMIPIVGGVLMLALGIAGFKKLKH